MLNFLTNLDSLLFIQCITDNTLKLCCFPVQIDYYETNYHAWIQRIDVIAMLLLSRGTRMIVIFVITLLDGVLHSINTSLMINCFLCMVPKFLSIQNVNLILEKKNYLERFCPTDSSCYMYDPFNFDSRSDIIIVKQYIMLRRWDYFLTPCISIVHPIISFSLM